MNLLPLAPIVTRLQDGSCPSLRKVGTAADMATAAAKGAVVGRGPNVTVMLLGAQALAVRDGTGPLRQVMDVTFGALVGVTLAGAQGSAGIAALEGPCGEVRAALFGWSHPDGLIQCHSAGEGIEDFDATTGVLLYRLDFITRVSIGAVS